MICDKLINIHLYRGFNESVDACIDFIELNDLSSLPLGSTIINETCLVNVFEYELSMDDQLIFEGHYLKGDIHFTIKGSEIISFSHPEDIIETTQPYTSESDVYLCKAKKRCDYVVDDSHFVLTLKDDIHQVRGYNNESLVKKIVFKFTL